METFGTNLVAFCGKIPDQKYNCKYCDYTCVKKYNWEKHINTVKHKMAQGNQMEIICGKKWQNTKYICEKCEKEFISKSGLWKHNSKINCTQEKKINTNDKKTEISPELVVDLINDNKELRQLVLEQNKTITELAKTNVSQINNSNINSHNKTFNLQLFLNETCKDAMNIMDFVDSIKLQLSDLEKVGELGYVEGISNIIVKNLKDMDITERPVHCTDSKRETIYIKDENKWEKENEDKNKLKKAIKRVANKNIGLLNDFKKLYPDCMYSESKKSDQYNKIIIEAFEINNLEKQEKVIKKIAKEVTIDKNTGL